MKILLVAINAKYIHSNPAVYSLKACAGEYAQFVDIAEFTINQQPSFILREIYKKKPDVAAFSCYIWNRSMIDSVIFDLHKILPDTDIWAGGPEVSYGAYDELGNWPLRGVMSGAGERIFYRLAEAYASGREDSLPAVLDGNVSGRIPLDEIPFWYNDLKNFENRIIYYESSRGCPFSCSYCLSSVEKDMDFRSVRRVCGELDFFLEHKVPQVKFIDRTFNCRKDHALPILKHILENDNGITNFHFEIAADLLDEDYFDIFDRMRPGAVQLEIGIQSTYPGTLEAVRRKTDLNKVRAAVKRLSSPHSSPVKAGLSCAGERTKNRNNIHIHLDLIAGLPFEDLDTFKASFNDVYSLCPQQLQLGFLKVLKGSGMEREACAYKILYTKEPPYEVLSTEWLSYEDICRLKRIEEVLEIYYNSGQFSNTLAMLEEFFPAPFELYDSVALWYEENGLSCIQSSRVKKYEILLEFGLSVIGGLYNKQGIEDEERDRQISVIKENIIFDMYLREDMKNRPAFAPQSRRWAEEVRIMLHAESETHRIFPELSDCSYRELTKLLHAEVFEHIFEEPVLVLFCYKSRDPVSGSCKTAVKSMMGKSAERTN